MAPDSVPGRVCDARATASSADWEGPIWAIAHCGNCRSGTGSFNKRTMSWVPPVASDSFVGRLDSLLFAFEDDGVGDEQRTGHAGGLVVPASRCENVGDGLAGLKITRQRRPAHIGETDQGHAYFRISSTPAPLNADTKHDVIVACRQARVRKRLARASRKMPALEGSVRAAQKGPDRRP